MNRAQHYRFLGTVSLAALILLGIAWELWLAPLRPGGSWLALKVLPLLWVAPGIARGNRYTYRVSTMLILAYFAEGAVRAYTEQGLSGSLALAEITLTVLFFGIAVAYVRASSGLKPATPGTTA